MAVPIKTNKRTLAVFLRTTSKEQYDRVNAYIKRTYNINCPLSYFESLNYLFIIFSATGVETRWGDNHPSTYWSKKHHTHKVYIEITEEQLLQCENT